MLVSEIFRTLQGEGRYAGYPCLFLRTSGCNLRCAWCDTPYTSWTVEGESLDVEEILELTKPWAEVEHAVISGGEPLLQKDLAKVIAGLKTQGHFITVETAGTLFESEVRPDFFSISPKLANSRPNSERHATELALHDRNNDHKHLEHYLTSGIEYQIKFVICSEEDIPEILDLVERFQLPRQNVYLMPEGVTHEALERHGQIVAEICFGEGFNFTGRMHVELWGNQRRT